jgi:hypothetical protein
LRYRLLLVTYPRGETVGRLLLIAAAIGVVLAVAVGFLASDLLSGTGSAQPAHATLYNYGTR